MLFIRLTEMSSRAGWTKQWYWWELSLQLCVLYCVIVCVNGVCKCRCICVCVLPCAHVEARERPQESCSTLAALFLETGSLTQPGACHFSYRLDSQPDPASVYLPPLTPIPSAEVTPGFCVDVRDPNPSPYERSPGNFILFCLMIWGMGGKLFWKKFKIFLTKCAKITYEQDR